MYTDDRSNQVIYVLMFDRPIGSGSRKVCFYGGWTRNLEGRLHYHSIGKGCKLTKYARKNGIGWTLVYSAPGTVEDEKAMKRYRNYKDFLKSRGVDVAALMAKTQGRGKGNEDLP